MVSRRRMSRTLCVMTTTTETTTPNPEPKRLERAQDGRMLTGVAAGIGRYLGIDANLVRIGFVVLTFVGGTGILAYLAAAAAAARRGWSNPRSSGTLRLPWRSGAGRAAMGATFLVLAAAVRARRDRLGHWDTARGDRIVGLGVMLIAAAFAGGARWLIIPGLLLAGHRRLPARPPTCTCAAAGATATSPWRAPPTCTTATTCRPAAAHRPARPAAEPRARSEASAPASGWATS